MDVRDYPVDVRADYPERSSRLWAVLTIFWIKALALIPHVVALAILGIAQFLVALVAQFVVAFKGEYPAGMHDFVTGVLRWQTRVGAFFLSITDRYPPFSFQPKADYPVDVVAVRPAKPSRGYAIATILVEILVIVIGIAVAVWLFSRAVTVDSHSSSTSTSDYNIGSALRGLVLRQLAALPHFVVLFFIGIAVTVIWVVVQWVILFVARFPYGMWDLETGFLRWYTRVNAYALGLIDCYPPFSMRPSIGGAPTGQPMGQPIAPLAPPPVAAWPQAPAAGVPQPPAVQAPAPHAPPPPDVPAPQAPPPPEPPRQEPPQAPPPAGGI